MHGLDEHKQQATKVPQTTTVSPSEQCESESWPQLGQKQTTRSNSQSEYDEESPWTGMDSQLTSYNDKSKHANLATTIPNTNQQSTNTDSCESTCETTATLKTHENNQIGEKLVNMKVLEKKYTSLNILSLMLKDLTQINCI